MNPVVCTDEVVVGGVPLRYRWDGPPAGPVVVLSNSLGTTAAMWGPQVGALIPYARVLRYEHRGHGGASLPPAFEGPGSCTIDSLGADLVGLLDALDVERASVAGLSLGGMVAMWVAAHHPSRVERLALCCTSAHMPPPEAWADRAAAVRAEGTAHLVDGLLGRWFTPGFPTRRPDVAALVAGMLGAASAEGYASCCDAIAAMDQRAALRSVAAPTLVLAGAGDPVTPPDVALQLAQEIPGASLLVVAGAAHLATLEQPAEVSAALADHLVGRPAERGDTTRRAVLGDAHVDRSATGLPAWAAPFTDFITRYAWGDIWARPGLDRATRSCVTIAVLAALGRSDELALHVRAARRNGLRPETIGAVLLHCAVYAGVPAANTAFAVARRALDDDG